VPHYLHVKYPFPRFGTNRHLFYAHDLSHKSTTSLMAIPSFWWVVGWLSSRRQIFPPSGKGQARTKINCSFIIYGKSICRVSSVVLLHQRCESGVANIWMDNTFDLQTSITICFLLSPSGMCVPRFV
jgi:hypothetical protein